MSVTVYNFSNNPFCYFKKGGLFGTATMQSCESSHASLFLLCSFMIPTQHELWTMTLMMMITKNSARNHFLHLVRGKKERATFSAISASLT